METFVRRLKDLKIKPQILFLWMKWNWILLSIQYGFTFDLILHIAKNKFFMKIIRLINGEFRIYFCKILKIYQWSATCVGGVGSVNPQYCLQKIAYVPFKFLAKYEDFNLI